MLLNNAPSGEVLDYDLIYFMAACHRSGLDPITHQIYAVYREGKMAIQTGIDGFRSIAEDSGEYAGSDDAVYDDETGEHPNKATVTVYRVNGITGERMPVTASARWNEYAAKKRDGSLMPNWRKMPYLMLAKCAEALALRKAFPKKLRGIYTDDEMSQADNLPQPERRGTSITLKGAITSPEQAKALADKIKNGQVDRQVVEAQS